MPLSESSFLFTYCFACADNLASTMVAAEWQPHYALKQTAAAPMTEEVANLVTYVCSPLSAATNGADLRVDVEWFKRASDDDRASIEPFGSFVIGVWS